MTTSSLSRFQILDENQLMLPGQCAVCRTHKGKFIDFGMQLEFHGAVYLCIDNCIGEAAAQTGYYPQRMLDEKVEQIRLLEQLVSELKKKKEEVDDELAAYHRILRDGTANQLPVVPTAEDTSKSSERGKQIPT